MARNLTVRSNHQWRKFSYRSEVPKKVLLDQFDWMIPESIRENPELVDLWCKGEDDSPDYTDEFFCYQGCWYHTSNFMQAALDLPKPFAGWHGALSDSISTGVIIKLSDDRESYQVATFRS
jgi:hypothetical protein